MKSLADIQLDERHRVAIDAASAAIRAAFPVDQIILFGSTARGDAGPDSDIDLLILTQRALTLDEHHNIISVIYPIQLELDVLLSPLVVSTRDWYEGVYQAMPLRREVDRDGVAA